MPGRGLNLLSLDGGGIRGLSSLQVLKNILERIGREQGLQDPPKPCDFFDMIGGTSTGGLIAIMLGRMRMTVDECIEAYVHLSDRVFRQTHSLPFSFSGKVRGKFDSKALEEAVKEYLSKYSLSEDCLLQDIDQTSCKVFVCATSGSTRKTVVLSSYSTPRTNSDRLKYTTVWQAARATSAASSFFDPIDVQLGSYKESYTDGATGANNPIFTLWQEAKEAFLGPEEVLEDNIDCVISIGTGVPGIEPFGSSLKAIAKSIVAISTETEETAKVFRRTHENLVKSERYFRFNVTHGLEVIGLERTDRKDDIVNITNLYLEEDSTDELMKRCVNTLKQHEGETNLNLKNSRAITLRARRMRNSSYLSPFVGIHDRRLAPRSAHELLDDISVYDPETRLKSISTRVLPGTAQWILSNDDFTLWRDQIGRPFFLCTGIVGSGKTMLASSVVEALVHAHHGNQGIIAHYFLDPNYPRELNATALLKGLIRQMVEQLQVTNHLPQWLADILQNTFYRRASLHSVSMLHGILQKLLSVASKSTIIIDGLHEMAEKEVSVLLEVIRQFSMQPLLAEKIKLGIFTREEIGRSVNVGTALPKVIHLQLTIELLENDIAFFIDERIYQKTMYEHQLTDDEAMLEDVRSTIRRNGGKMLFLWIDLQLNTIWKTCLNDEDIRNALDGLPIGIEDTYMRCLRRLAQDPITSKYGYRVLYLTAYVQRPLSQIELREAISVPEMSDHWDEKKIINGPLLRYCANLVEQDHLTAIIRFVHPSVKAFLVAHFHPNQHHATSVLTGKAYTPETSFETVGMEYCRDTCFKYLTMNDFGSQVALRSTIQTAVSNREIIEKTIQGGNKMTRWWASHKIKKMRSAQAKSQSTLSIPKKPTQNLYEDPVHAQKYHLLFYVQDHWPYHALTLRDADPAWPTFVALATMVNSAYRLHPWIQFGMSPAQIQQSAFVYAIANNSLPLLQTVEENVKSKHLALLIKMSLNEKGEKACHLAASREILDWLIRIGGKKQLAHRDARGNTPLHSSAANGNIETLDLILDHTSPSELLTSRNQLNITPIMMAIEGTSSQYLNRAMQAIQTQAGLPRNPEWKAEHLQDAFTSLLRTRPNASNKLSGVESFIKMLVEALLEVHQDVSWDALVTLAIDDDVFLFFDLFLEHPNSRAKIAGTIINKPPDAPIGASVLTQACTISTTTKPDRIRIIELLLEDLPEEVTWHTVREKEGAEKVDMLWPLSLAMSQVALSTVAVDIVRVLSRQLLKLSEQRKFVPQMIEEFGRPPDGDLDYLEILQRIDADSVKDLLISGALKLQQHYDNQPKTNLLHISIKWNNSGLVKAIANSALEGKAHNLVYYLGALDDIGKTALTLAIDGEITDLAIFVMQMIDWSLDFDNIFFQQRFKDGPEFRHKVSKLIVDTIDNLNRDFGNLATEARHLALNLQGKFIRADEYSTSWGYPMKLIQELDSTWPVFHETIRRVPSPTLATVASSHRSSLSGESVYLSACENLSSSECEDTVA